MSMIENGNLFGQKEILAQMLSELHNPLHLRQAGRVCKLWNVIIKKEHPELTHENNAAAYLKKFSRAFPTLLKEIRPKCLTQTVSKLVSGNELNIDELAMQINTGEVANGYVTIKNKIHYLIVISVKFIAQETRIGTLVLLNSIVSIESSRLLIKKKGQGVSYYLELHAQTSKNFLSQIFSCIPCKPIDFFGAPYEIPLENIDESEQETIERD